MADISQETLNAIQTAKASLEAAKNADNDHIQAQTALEGATQNEKDKLQTAADAHKKAATDAHAALDALTKELELI